MRLHDLRHSFASALVNDGKGLYTVQQLLGHANGKATQRYAHLTRETLAEAAEAMGKLVGPILEGRPYFKVLRLKTTPPKQPYHGSGWPLENSDLCAPSVKSLRTR